MNFIKKTTKFSLLLFISILSYYSHAQSILSFCDKDDIAGFYCPEWSYGIEFRTDGRMKMSRKNFNEEEVISGKWEKRNDTIFVEFDTTHCSVIATNFCVTGLYCTSFVRDDDIILHVYYKYLDRQLNYRAYIKTACFYATDSLKIESKYTLFGNIFTTTYYENGKVDEIKECFNDKKNEILKSGICLKYDTIGRLVIYQQWDKGKKIYEKKFNYTTLDTINSNEIKKRINKHGRFIVTSTKMAKVDEIKDFYNRGMVFI
ncbi:MAG: hypothetical protein IPN94_07125 [Sphingobacteriales bacterium]|nr:hypothetical protein [Sphingobacteriales bacterium]